MSDGAVLPEPRGPVAGGVYVGYFTTPQALGYTADNSRVDITGNLDLAGKVAVNVYRDRLYARSEEHTSELQSLMRIPYAVLCLKKKERQRRRAYYLQVVRKG